MRSSESVIPPQTLHPALWRADQLGSAREAVTPSGFAVLDAQLPGGGWPHRALTELLLPHPGVGEMRLLAPALARREGRCVMLVEPPAAPCAPALGHLGLDVRRWLVLQTGSHPDALWALEQALRSGQIGAALAWLPAGGRAEVLRRLQLAAQAHDAPAFVFRGLEAGRRPSAAPLRLTLAPAGADAIAVRLVKRRGPPLAEPIVLALAPVLDARRRADARGDRVRGRSRGAPAVPCLAVEKRVHVLPEAAA